MKKQLLILMTLFTVAIGYSQTVGDQFTEGFITYGITSITLNTVEAIVYNTAGGTSVSIPATATNASSSIAYSVTSIGQYSFSQKNLISVSIPNTVTNIGHQSLGQNNLSSITIPNSVLVIDDYAFQSNQLTEITIPSSVTSIGNGAFRANPLGCITSEATNPPTITTGGVNDSFNANRSNINLSMPTGTLGAYTSALWTGFNSVAEGLTGTFVVDNITYQINPTPNNEVTVTNYNTAGGTVVNIPTSVTSGCTVFSVVAIGDFALENMNLTGITIPNSVSSIGQNAFAFNSLMTLTIPDSVLTIGDGAFVQNNNLDNVVIGNNVTNIGEFAFRFCGLTSITIPDSVTNISSLAFGSNSLTNIVIGTSVTSIGNSAFGYNNLTSVTIPNSVTNIGDLAFRNNLLLTDIFSESITPPTITTGGSLDTFVYNGDRSTIHLHIPSGTSVMGAYVNDAGALWTGFNPVTQDALLSTSGFELANDIKIITTRNAIKVVYSDNVNLQNYVVYSITGKKSSYRYQK